MIGPGRDGAPGPASLKVARVRSDVSKRAGYRGDEGDGMDLGLSDRVYVVTGAGRGLGRACAIQLAGEGARLVLTDRDQGALSAVAAGVGGPERAIAISGDLAESGFETCLTAAAVARYGRLDGSVICPDDVETGSLAATADETWRAGFEGTFLGPIRLARSVARNVSVEGGSVLFVLGRSARQPLANRAVANGLVPGVAMAARGLAGELGPRNIRVNLLIPGHCESEVGQPGVAHRGAGDLREDQESGLTHEQARREAEDAVPLRRFGEALEFARPAVFLLSPAASYVTGSVLVVDGGLSRSL